MLTAREVRQKFLDFFVSKNHLIVPSAPLVVKNDPTLMFNNAGMSPFKDIFLGHHPPPAPRVVNTQKCLRVSGKHNDLEEVGVDTYHHTMFEMLGNWSFGDYFKKEAIHWAWELLTEVYQLPKERLYVTVFSGDAADRIEKDSESADIWAQLLPAERILAFGKKSNFWEMGDTGPCGPCSEIHVDCRPEAARQKIPAQKLINADHPEVIELWNLVFMEFNRHKNGTLHPLPEKHVDTGMGLERLVRVIQNKSSNYDTDLFQNTITRIEQISQQRYGGTNSYPDIAFRVISDHIRAIVLSICDGQLPENHGAGYVIKRILRRAVRYYYTYFQRKEPLLHLLVPTLAELLAPIFPEIQAQAAAVSRILLEEELSFLKTIDNGIKKLRHIIDTHPETQTISGHIAFELYDTYGFPFDLTRLILSESGKSVEESEFLQALDTQKKRSRKAQDNDISDWVILAHAPQTFIGYTQTQNTTYLLQYRKVQHAGQTSYQLVLAQTPFYAESGGQCGDKGWLYWDEEQIEVLDTQKENGLILQKTHACPTRPKAPVQTQIDLSLRRQATQHHSATHLLHSALKAVVGTFVDQKGSSITKESLRFDFSAPQKLSERQLQDIHDKVNQHIQANLPVTISEMSRKDALNLGAMALFGEKYGEKVRVVQIGDCSVELCGGTHSATTAEIGSFYILSESAVASGIRRIEAVAGESALRYATRQLQSLQSLQQLLKDKNVITAVQQLLSDKKNLAQQLKTLQEAALQQKTEALKQQFSLQQGIHILVERVAVPGNDALKKLAFALKGALERYLIVLQGDAGDKVFVIVLADEQTAMQDSCNARHILERIILPKIQGSGGGKATFASAGGIRKEAFPDIKKGVTDALKGGVTAAAR